MVRQALTAQIGTLRTVHDRVTDLVDPPKYLTTDALRDLEHDAQTAVGGFAAWWSKSLSDLPGDPDASGYSCVSGSARGCPGEG